MLDPFSQDIPALAAEASKELSNIPYIITAPLGLHELMVDIMNDRIKYCLQHVAGDVDECKVCAGTGKCRLYSWWWLPGRLGGHSSLYEYMTVHTASCNLNSCGSGISMPAFFSLFYHLEGLGQFFFSCKRSDECISRSLMSRSTKITIVRACTMVRRLLSACV